MTPLAALFLGAATTGNASTDVLWRNVNIDELMFTGVSPTKDLLDEIIQLNSGDPGRLYRLGRLIVGDTSASRALDPNSQRDLLTGIIDSPVCERSTLKVLRGHADLVVATKAAERLTYLDNMVQDILDPDKDPEDVVNNVDALMRTLHLESLRSVLGSKPNVIVRGLNSITSGTTETDPDKFLASVLCPANRGSWLHRMSVLDGRMYDEIMLSILSSEHGFVDERVAVWAINDARGLAYLEGLGKRSASFAKKCDVKARDALIKQGFIKKPMSGVVDKSYASLDGMIGLLTPDELGVMFFSTTAKVADSTVDHILDSASLTMIANFMFGNTMRQPKTGEISGMLARSNLDRKLDLAKVLNNIYTGSTDPGAPSPHGEHVAYLPWADELLLAFTRLNIPALREETAVKLFATVSQKIGSEAASWEYLMILCNEWDSTFIDLLDSASAIVK